MSSHLKYIQYENILQAFRVHQIATHLLHTVLKVILSFSLLLGCGAESSSHFKGFLMLLERVIWMLSSYGVATTVPELHPDLMVHHRFSCEDGLSVAGWSQTKPIQPRMDEMDAELGCHPICPWNAFIALKMMATLMRSSRDRAAARVKKMI